MPNKCAYLTLGDLPQHMHVFMQCYKGEEILGWLILSAVNGKPASGHLCLIFMSLFMCSIVIHIRGGNVYVIMRMLFIECIERDMGIT